MLDQGRVRFSFSHKSYCCIRRRSERRRYNVSFSEGVITFQGGLDANKKTEKLPSGAGVYREDFDAEGKPTNLQRDLAPDHSQKKNHT